VCFSFTHVLSSLLPLSLKSCRTVVHLFYTLHIRLFYVSICGGLSYLRSVFLVGYCKSFVSNVIIYGDVLGGPFCHTTGCNDQEGLSDPCVMMMMAGEC
jgi:hypothetical protein